jgi:hypothetical protein
LDSTVSGQGPVADCCECGDEPSGSCATELVSYSDTHFEVLRKQRNDLSIMTAISPAEDSVCPTLIPDNKRSTAEKCFLVILTGFGFKPQLASLHLIARELRLWLYFKHFYIYICMHLVRLKLPRKQHSKQVTHKETCL